MTSMRKKEKDLLSDDSPMSSGRRNFVGFRTILSLIACASAVYKPSACHHKCEIATATSSNEPVEPLPIEETHIMRTRSESRNKDFKVHAIAGTHTVLMALTCPESRLKGFRGFAFKRGIDGGQQW